MYPSVKNVVANNNHVLFINFDNGESGALDMKPFLNIGVFQKLKKLSSFKRVRVSFDTIEWESGVDLDPEFVYSKCQENQSAQQLGEADPKS
jgi:hypothetical protein